MIRKIVNQSNQPNLTLEMENLKKENQALLSQFRLLQEQLQQKKNADEEKNLESEAEKIQKQQAQLAEEANLRKILNEATVSERSHTGEIDDLTPKDMISIMSDVVGKAMEANSQLLESKLEQRFKALTNPLNERLEGTQKALLQMMAENSVGSARSKYKDFDDFREDIGKILQKAPTLSPDEAYLLAKSKKATTVPVQRQVESERPNLSPYPDANNVSEEETDVDVEPEYTSKKAEFQNAAMKAIEKVLSSRKTPNS